MEDVLTKEEALDTVSANVHRLMSEQGLSVREVGRRSETAPMIVSRLLRKIHMPSVDALCRIAESLGVTVDQLVKNSE